MQGRLPDVILQRRKKQFGGPTEEWLRGPLKPMLLDYLSPESIKAAGIFDADRISRLISNHLSRRQNNGGALRIVLLFELWRRRWVEQSAPVPIEVPLPVQTSAPEAGA
jgi:asparagine synthase (glutamine-hydrolysing)